MKDLYYEREIVALFDKYRPLLEAAVEADIKELAGQTPKDYYGEHKKLHDEFRRKCKAVRVKHGLEK